MKRVFDPLYGIIWLTDFEYNLLLSPELQRLRYVRLCNINSFLITGASEISRFEHSIGVLYLVKEWLKINRVPTNRAKCLIAAAILHDIQTSPFGHSIQYIFEDNRFYSKFIHQDLSHAKEQNFFQQIEALKSFSGYQFKTFNLFSKDEIKYIMNVISGSGEYGILMSGSLDFDNLDNVIRLAYHVGIADKNDANMVVEIVRDLKEMNNTLSISMKSVPLIKQWQKIRKRIYEMLLYDWADFSAKAMLSNAVEQAIEQNIIGVESWRYTDNELISVLERSSFGEYQEIYRIINRLKSGDLYYPLILLKTNDISKYEKISKFEFKRNFEQKLKKTGKIQSRIIFHPILDHKKIERSIHVILRESGKSLTIGEDSHQILIGIFISRIDGIKNDKLTMDLITESLESFGISELKPIADPFQEKNTLNYKIKQLKLFE